MARVAMLRLLSEIRFSKSTLQEVTASGWIMAIRFRVFTAENLMVGLADVRNICSTKPRKKIRSIINIRDKTTTTQTGQNDTHTHTHTHTHKESTSSHKSLADLRLQAELLS